MAVVTNVDLDHMDRLGPTIAHIAREKAAIIERGDLAVTGATGEALAVIRRRAARLDVPLRVVEPAPLLDQDRDGHRRRAARASGRPGSGCRPAPGGQRGRRRRAARRARRGRHRRRADAEARRRGYAAARWPGRLELLSAIGPAREVLLDGAHNPAGAAALAAALDDLRPYLRRRARRRCSSAAMADKDVDGVIAALRASTVVRGARDRRHEPGRAPGHAGRTTSPRAGGRPAPRDARGRSTTRMPRSRPALEPARPAVCSSWPARCTSSARSAAGSSTTRPCAIRRRAPRWTP